MTANGIISNALALMGYGQYNMVGYGDTNMLQNAMVAINQIIADLGGSVTVNEVGDKICLPPLALRALPYGVAMLLALSVGDAQRNAALGSIYNAFRASVKGSNGKISDVLPVSEVGV